MGRLISILGILKTNQFALTGYVVGAVDSVFDNFGKGLAQIDHYHSCFVNIRVWVDHTAIDSSVLQSGVPNLENPSITRCKGQIIVSSRAVSMKGTRERTFLMNDRQPFVVADYHLIGCQKRLRSSINIFPENCEVVSILDDTVYVNVFSDGHSNRLIRRLRKVGQVLPLWMDCAIKMTWTLV